MHNMSNHSCATGLALAFRLDSQANLVAVIAQGSAFDGVFGKLLAKFSQIIFKRRVLFDEFISLFTKRRAMVSIL